MMRLLVYVDFEMDKTINNEGNIISIGAIKVQDGEVIDTFKQMISLPPNVDGIDTYTTILTGIKASDLESCPYFLDGFSKFMKWADGCSYIYCWDNADINSIHYSCHQHCFRPKKYQDIKQKIIHFTNQYFVDLKPYITKIDAYTANMSLAHIYQCSCRQQVDIKQLHDPIYDCKILYEIHKSYIKRAKIDNVQFMSKERNVEGREHAIR